MARKVGLLAGTFDPTHLGHVALAQAALVAGGLDEVWLLVNPNPAHKVNVLSYVHRFAMAELAVGGQSAVKLVRGADAQVPHTMAGFGELARRHGDHAFVFIVGMDVMAGLDSWEEVEKVVREAAFLVARRPGADGRLIDDLRGRLGGLGRRLAARIFDFEGYNLASSKQVREAVRTGARPGPLDDRVYGYIVEHGLYR